MPAPHDMLEPDPRETKLPVWAQDLLRQARFRVRNAEAANKVARLATKPGESDMILDRYNKTSPIGLGHRPTVRVILSRREDGEPRRYIDVQLTEGGQALQLMGSGALNIRPQVTNVISLWTD